MNKHESINYIEFGSQDMAATKEFFNTVFGWEFEDYGPDYMAFSKAGMEGGFFKSEQTASTQTGSALVVFYSPNLEATLSRVKTAGGIIVKEIFSFPGGRRFHFEEPGGNELAVWSDQ